MAYMLRPLSLGGLLDETFYIYRKNFMLFVAISALPNLVMLLLRFSIEVSASRSGGGGGLAALGGLGAYFATLFVSALVTSTTTLAVPIFI
jgi:hypothetical protein